MIKNFKEEKELRKDHVKKIRIKILKIKELQLHQKFQKMLTMNPIDNKCQILKKTITLCINAFNNRTKKDNHKSILGNPKNGF